MKINLAEFSQQKIEGTTTSKKMRLSENAQSMVFQMFTKSVYSNPIGTVVREITSNCFDSHVEAGVKDMPVVIRKSFDDETETHYISFIDYGVGMSPDRIENVYSVYFESTKRVDNEQIGGFGIGAKSVLAYKRSTGMGEGEYDNSFYVITVFNGVKYVYMVYEGNESPEVSLLHSEATNESNGTEIRIPVLAKDLKTFEREMVKQLYYFENIVFDGFDDSEFVKNDYQIVRGKSFLFRGDEYSSNMHVCLGRVAYPIDFNALDLYANDYSIPIAIKLNVGDINVTVSRESLDYSEKTVKLLKQKLEEAKNEIIQIASKQFSNITTLEEYFQAKNKFGYIRMSNGKNIHIANIMSVKDIMFDNFKYKDLTLPNDRTMFRLFFDSKIYGKKPPKSSWRRNSNQIFDGDYESIMSKSNVYYIDREFERKIDKQRYLAAVHGTFFVIREVELNQWEKKEDIIGNFHLKSNTELFDKDGVPSDVMTDILELREDYLELFKKYREDYHEVVVPEDFKYARKNVPTTDILNREINTKIIGDYGKVKIKVKKFVEFPNTIFYGTQDDDNLLHAAYDTYKHLFDGTVVNDYSTYYDKFIYMDDDKRDSGIMFVMVAKNNIKYFNYCKHAYNINDVYWKLFHRKESKVMSYFNNGEVFQKYSYLDGFFKNPKFGLISKEWGDFIKTVNDEMKKLKETTNSNLGSIKYSLSKFFNLNEVSLTPEGKELMKKVEKLKTLEQMNEMVLKYVRVDYNGEYLDREPALVEILKKVMVL